MKMETSNTFWYQFLLASIFLYNSCLGLEYPNIRRDDSVRDNYHGVEIGDPYRWLEELETDATKEFVSKQNAISKEFLTSLPDRDKIKEQLTTLANYERFGVPRKASGGYCHFYNSGLQGHDVLVKLSDLSDNTTGSVILDPNELSEDGSISIYPYYESISPDGTKFVYPLATKGSDWLEGHVVDVTTGEVLPDEIRFTKWPEFAFSGNSDGFFYARFPLGDDGNPITTNSQIYYHMLGTMQEDDFFIFQNVEYPEWFLLTEFFSNSKAEVSHTGDTLILTPQPDFKSNSIVVANLANLNPIGNYSDISFINVFSALDDVARFIYVTSSENNFIFLSDKAAPNFQLIQVHINFETGDVTNSTVLVGEHSTRVLKWVSPVGSDFLLLCYFEDVQHKLEIRHISDGSLLQEIQFPFPGVISDNHVTAEDTEFFFRLENLVQPGVVFRCYCISPSACLEFKCDTWKSMTLGNVNMSNFLMEQVFYPSKDGTLIPMFIGHSKDIVMNSDNPTLLFGYGGFNADVLPTFSALTFTFVHYFNGVYASANIRGGAEYGERWHQGGSLLNKQNSFDDFQHAAMYLTERNFTRPAKLAIQGSSNGGLLVATCLNQRPDLFGVGLPDVGLMDMLRFHLSAIGFAWCSEYGCSDNETHFRNLITYSPIHNIGLNNNSQQFPSVLVTTADHDDRVLPWNSYKYVAELQHSIGSSPMQVG
ncbi:Prolyl endopeptidase [Folsomia candida]|uniref:Prolyl endopeptidase n=1 Tax=Folsomia candida TaxID=158441 RepID=A0A226EAT6_FOLCA|nr:Prolyl endopeptidase [Folsomia candida]